jgi:hypothetical protein
MMPFQFNIGGLLPFFGSLVGHIAKSKIGLQSPKGGFFFLLLQAPLEILFLLHCRKSLSRLFLLPLPLQAEIQHTAKSLPCTLKP